MLTHALEGDQTQIRLAERCAMDKTTMVVTVDELERLGLAERRPSPTDRYGIISWRTDLVILVVMAAVERVPDLAMLFAEASHSLQTELTARLEHLGLTPREQCVLIKALDGDRTQIQLAELCQLDKTTMVVTVDRLEQRGLVERRPAPTDRRARIIAVTEAGRDLAVSGDALVQGIYADVLDSLPEDEREPFVDALTRLVNVRLANPPACVQPVRRRPRSG